MIPFPALLLHWIACHFPGEFEIPKRKDPEPNQGFIFQYFPMSYQRDRVMVILNPLAVANTARQKHGKIDHFQYLLTVPYGASNH